MKTSNFNINILYSYLKKITIVFATRTTASLNNKLLLAYLHLMLFHDSI